MGYFYFDNDNDVRKYKYTGLVVILALVTIIYSHFFGYSETMACTENHCDIYKVKNSNKVAHLYKSFNKEDIIGYDVTEIGRRSEYRTYIPVVILKDGSRIKLNTLETNNYTEASHTTFVSLRNKKFPK